MNVYCAKVIMTVLFLIVSINWGHYYDNFKSENMR